MEYEYEKDVMKILKMLEYSMKGFSYEYEGLLKNATFTEPCTTFSISLEELESNGISEQKVDKLFYGICKKQGLPPYDFMDEHIEELTDDEGEEHIANIHTIRKSKDGKFIKFPVVYWISDVINDIENNREKTENPELITKNFDANNFIILNGLTGDFTYNKVIGKLSTGSRKFKIFRALLHSKTNSVTYDELAKILFQAEAYNSALHREGLFDALGSLKEELGILPLKNKKNLDCFENENQAYRLVQPI
jgi:hypothetical protein